MKNEIYKRFKLNPKKAKPGDLMRAAMKRKSEGKKFPVLHKKHKANVGDQPSMANWKPTKGGFNYPKPGAGTMAGNPKMPMMAKKNKKHKSIAREMPLGSLTSKMNSGGPNNKKLQDQAEKFSKKTKKHKEHSAEAIKGLKDFVSEESKEKKVKKHKTMCKSCGKSHAMGKHKGK